MKKVLGKYNLMKRRGSVERERKRERKHQPVHVRGERLIHCSNNRGREAKFNISS